VATPSPEPIETWARRYCVSGLFAGLCAGDPLHLDAVRTAIEASLSAPGAAPAGIGIEDFAAAAQRLYASQHTGPAPFRCIALDLRTRRWDPLFIRAELLRALRQAAGCARILVVVRGLRAALDGGARRRTRGRIDRHQRIRADLDELVSQWTTAGSEIHILYL
jgi:hypothetical protein